MVVRVWFTDRMADPDPMLQALDAFIAQQEHELEKAREFRSWWTSRRTDAAPVPPWAVTLADPAVPAVQAVTKGRRNQPVLKDRLKSVLAKAGPSRVREIQAELERMGWTTQSKTPDTVIRNTLGTLVEHGEVVRSGRLYSLPTVDAGDEPRIPIAYIEPGSPKSVFHPPEQEEEMG